MGNGGVEVTYETLTSGGTCVFWCIFSFLFGLVLASFNKSLLIYLVFAISLLIIKGYIYDYCYPWHMGEACLAILTGIGGLVIGKGLIWKHAR